MHRSGRTGRAGRKGVCVTLYGPRDRAALQNIEWATGNKFEWTGAPSPKSLLKAAAQTACDDAVAVDDETLAYFEEAAAALLEARGGDPVRALAAALAVATGTTAPPADRSLLTNSDGYVTMVATMKKPVPSMGFVWGALRSVLPEGATDGTENVRHMQLTADGHGAVFDMKAALLKEELKAFLSSEKNSWLQLCTENLPQLQERENRDGDGGKGGKGGGGKGGGKGGKGGRGGGGGGGSRDAAEGAYYSPAMVENPWHRLLPNEPPVFAFAGGSLPTDTSAFSAKAMDEPGRHAVPRSPSPERLPSPSPQLLAPPEQELARLRFAASELGELLRDVSDPACVKQLCPIILESLDRVRAVVNSHRPAQEPQPMAMLPPPPSQEQQPSPELEQPPKRSRMMLPPPKASAPDEVACGE